MSRSDYSFQSLQRDIEEQFSGLQTLTNTRLHRLEESKKLHQYLREVNETAEWITEQLHVAAAEDYGKDFEHLEVCSSHLLFCVTRAQSRYF